MQNPKLWSENYLKENGALALVESFNPKGGKLDRARKFIQRYGDVLHKADKFDELNAEVSERYNIQLK